MINVFLQVACYHKDIKYHRCGMFSQLLLSTSCSCSSSTWTRTSSSRGETTLLSSDFSSTIAHFHFLPLWTHHSPCQYKMNSMCTRTSSFRGGAILMSYDWISVFNIEFPKLFFWSFACCKILSQIWYWNTKYIKPALPFCSLSICTSQIRGGTRPGQLLSLYPCRRPKILARMLFWEMRGLIAQNLFGAIAAYCTKLFCAISA